MTSWVVMLGCAAAPPDADFGAWDDSVFARAERQDRLVLLSIGTEWCHWCHVMDETTWANSSVREEVAAGFIAVRVDAESRPDLAARYEDYGWPATIVLNAAGEDLVRFRGYVPPERMASVLAAVRADPTPGPSVLGVPEPGSGPMDDALREELRSRLEQGWDDAGGSFGRTTRFLDPGNVAWSLAQPSPWPERARRTVANTAEHLVDPVWGGGYQYSDGGVWDSPHFEKIAWVQAADLAAFARARARWGDAAQAGDDVLRYLEGFLLQPDGAFGTSQDADVVRGDHAAEYFALDDAGRRARGVPAVDHSVWPRENGLIVESLAWRAMWLGDDEARDRAAAAWHAVVGRYRPGDRGFERDGGPFLGDTTAMGRAAFALWQATADDVWLARSLELAAALPQWQRADGYAATAAPGPLEPVVPYDENVELARWARDLHAATGEEHWRDVAGRALDGAATRARAPRLGVGALLLADAELARGPADVRVVGPASEPLWRAALAVPVTDRLIRRWDGRVARPSWAEDLPPAETASAFLCRDGSCAEFTDAGTLARALSG